ncbi:type III secretion system inner membrane ring subunit SctD [Bordetella ansorpii]|uniref:type III secretion system inner membrane ring subunit SctD n=1 Tax=Bordetella ansorpii TaxID=288768 RepID=UPI0009EF6298|nr:type III secretion system inner membrane ring subunit SctD [Bordetella ansorpii]
MPGRGWRGAGIGSGLRRGAGRHRPGRARRAPAHRPAGLGPGARPGAARRPGRTRHAVQPAHAAGARLGHGGQARRPLAGRADRRERRRCRGVRRDRGHGHGPGGFGARGPRSGAAGTGPAPARPAAAPPRKRDSWPIVLGLAAVVLTILVAIGMVWLLPSTPKPVERPDPRVAAERSIGQITAALERLGLASRLHVAMSRDGTVLVSGWVRNAAEQDSVASALSQIWPMPALRVSAEDAAVASAATTLKAFSVRYAPRYDGDGRMTILGIAASARERASALDAVRAQLPGMTVLGNDIALAPDVADALSARLAEAGLSGIALTWKTDRLEAGAGGLDDDQLSRLQAVVKSFNATHLDVVALAQPAAADRQFADSVPFGIRSVVGGPQPYVVLEDGSKLLVGGMHKQYRLTAVEPKRLIFEGPRPAIVLR